MALPVNFIKLKICSSQTTLLKPTTIRRQFTASQIPSHPESRHIRTFGRILLCYQSWTYGADF